MLLIVSFLLVHLFLQIGTCLWIKRLLIGKSAHKSHHFQLVAVLIFTFEPFGGQVHVLDEVGLQDNVLLVTHLLKHKQLLIYLYSNLALGAILPQLLVEGTGEHG